MKTIKVTDTLLKVNSGRVGLTAAQARPRLHCLAPVKVNKDGTGTYEVTAPIQFKIGETFGFDGEIGKTGVLFDPAAEELARVEAAKRADKEKAIAVEKAVEAAKADFAAELEPKLRKEIEADLISKGWKTPSGLI